MIIIIMIILIIMMIIKIHSFNINLIHHIKKIK